MRNGKIVSILIMVGILLSFTGVSTIFGAVDNSTANNSSNIIKNKYNGIIYVSPEGKDSNDGFTPETAKKTIKNAVNRVKKGGIVQVAPGTYIEDTISIGKKLTLQGSDPKNTIIKSKGDAIEVYADEVLIKGFTITPQKYHTWKRGIWTNHFLTVENCIIKGFKAKTGAGIRTRLCVLIVKNCTIIDNKSVWGYGGGIRSGGGSLTVLDSVIANNTSTGLIDGAGGGIALFETNLNVKNSTITGNHAAYGGGIWSNNGLVNLENSIISNNTASLSGGGISHYYEGKLNINNVTFEGNKPDAQDIWLFFNGCYW